MRYSAVGRGVLVRLIESRVANRAKEDKGKRDELDEVDLT